MLRTPPCGAPTSISNFSETEELIFITYDLFFNSSAIHFIMYLSKLFLISLNRTPLCQILSNAFVISKKIMQFFIFLFMASTFFWHRLKILSFVCLCALNPDCCLTKILFFFKWSLIFIRSALSQTLAKQLVRDIGRYLLGLLRASFCLESF